MNHKHYLGKKIMQASYLRGSFKLRSGQISEEYFDKYRFESNPQLLKEITFYLKNLVPPETELLAGLELGGVPLATSLSLSLDLPCVFVRKKAKPYGTNQIAEGASSLHGKYVLVIEDVITTGGQVLASIQDLKNMGAHIIGVICVILRGHGQNIRDQGLLLRHLFTMDELKSLM